MHFAGVCTEPDPRHAAAMSNLGISPSADDAICEPRMPTHTDSRIVRTMSHLRSDCLNATNLIDHLVCELKLLERHGVEIGRQHDFQKLAVIGVAEHGVLDLWRLDPA